MPTKEAGFTLVEIMIVLVLLGLISSAIYSLYLTSWKVWNFNQDRIDLQQNARVAMINLTQRIRRTLAIENNGDWPSNELVLKLKDESNQVYYVRYIVYDNKLGYRKKDKTNDWPTGEWPTEAEWGSYKRPLTTEVISNQRIFDYEADKRLVIINLKLQLKERNYNLKSKVYLRNY